MPLDIVIFKQGKEKEYVSIDEKLHLLMFSQDAIKQGRCRELSKIKDYYLTDVIFMGNTLTNFVEDLRITFPYNKTIRATRNRENTYKWRLK